MKKKFKEGNMNVKRLNTLIYFSILLVLVLLFYFSGTYIMRTFSALMSLLAPFLVGGILAYILNPICDYLTKVTRMPRGLAATLTFIIFIGALIFFVFAAVPLMIAQLSALITSAPEFIEDTSKAISDLYSNASQNLQVKAIADNLLKNIEKGLLEFVNELDIQDITVKSLFALSTTISNIVSFLIALIFIPLTSIYIMTDYYDFTQTLVNVVPRSYRKLWRKYLHIIDGVMGEYIRGMIISSFFVAVGSTIGFLIIGLPNAFLLGIFCGIFNVVPYIGPYVGMLPALIVGIPGGWLSILLTGLVVLVVQQIDANVVGPLVQSRGLKVHPLTILVSIVIFGYLFGAIGLLIAIPLAAIIKQTIIFYRTHKRELLALRKRQKN